MLLPTERDAGQLSFFLSLSLRERFAIVPWQPQLLILPGWNKPLFKDLKLLASNSKDDKQQPYNESPCNMTNKVVFFRDIVKIKHIFLPKIISVMCIDVCFLV